jgi:hypothetical protein
MKQFLLFVAAVSISAVSFAQQKKASDVVKFQELTYNFGKVKQSVTVTHNFAFTNISDAPVIIESAVASCGCTTPVKPQGAIAKGQSDKITAGFSAPAVGAFNKTITIKVAGTDLPVQLTITGEVLNADDYAKYQSGKDKTAQPAKSGS